MNLESDICYDDSEDRRVVRLLALALLSNAVDDVQYYKGQIHNEAVAFLNLLDIGFIFWCKCAEIDPTYFLANMICKNDMYISDEIGSPINKEKKPTHDAVKVYITANCERCCKEFQYYQHKANPQRFCSIQCSNKSKGHKGKKPASNHYMKWKS